MMSRCLIMSCAYIITVRTQTQPILFLRVYLTNFSLLKTGDAQGRDIYLPGAM